MGKIATFREFVVSLRMTLGKVFVRQDARTPNLIALFLLSGKLVEIMKERGGK